MFKKTASKIIHPDEIFEESQSFGIWLSDKVSDFGGSWRFIISFMVFIIFWIIINTIVYLKHFDPYPFILLNLILSTIAALQAPVIMMSQNRQEQKDRLRAEMDYEINIKAEKQITEINLKLDALIEEIQNLKEKKCHE